MGAWGIGIFENDAAADWLFDYEAVGASAVLQAFSDAKEQAASGYIDVDAGSMVLAAGEVVATLSKTKHLQSKLANPPKNLCVGYHILGSGFFRWAVPCSRPAVVNAREAPISFVSSTALRRSPHSPRFTSMKVACPLCWRSKQPA